MATATAEKKTVKKTAHKAASKPDTEAEVKAAPKAAAKAKSGDFAVIETGGKQYGVQAGDSIKIEKILGEHKVGDSINFDKVLLVEGADVAVGTPYITGAKVSATISEIGRNTKVTVIKYKQKSRYFKKNGHRQPFFKVKIDSIS